jgi:D-inositol-3-phosphate glycosyltransferase
MIDDPFDPPGHERYGGGHVFLFDLGRYLVRRGFNLTYIIRNNSSNKKKYEKIGDNCTIIRLGVGPAKEIDPSQVSYYIEPLKKEFTKVLTNLSLIPQVVHTSYWISGIVALPYTRNNNIKHVHSVLSLGRLKLKRPFISKDEKYRDKSEIKLFNSADELILVCPDEINSLKKLYPEVNNKNLNVISYGINENIFFPRPESTDHYVRRSSSRFQ